MSSWQPVKVEDTIWGLWKVSRRLKEYPWPEDIIELYLGTTPGRTNECQVSAFETPSWDTGPQRGSALRVEQLYLPLSLALTKPAVRHMLP